MTRAEWMAQAQADLSAADNALDRDGALVVALCDVVDLLHGEAATDPLAAEWLAAIVAMVGASSTGRGG